jgi:hypothetical protein
VVVSSKSKQAKEASIFPERGFDNLMIDFKIMGGACPSLETGSQFQIYNHDFVSCTIKAVKNSESTKSHGTSCLPSTDTPAPDNVAAPIIVHGHQRYHLWKVKACDNVCKA